MVVDRLTIETKNAFKNNYAYQFQRRAWMYVCSKGSQWARPDEVLVSLPHDGVWIAFDASLRSDGRTYYCCQPIFRCLNEDVTLPGDHVWQTNQAVSENGNGLAARWDGELWAQTRVP